MSAYLIAHVDVTNPEGYEEYRAQVPAVIAAYGGRYLVRGGACEVLEGDWTPKRLVLLEFPTMEQARAFYGSSEYAEALALRHAAAESSVVLLDGLDRQPWE